MADAKKLPLAKHHKVAVPKGGITDVWCNKFSNDWQAVIINFCNYWFPNLSGQELHILKELRQNWLQTSSDTVISLFF